MNLLQKLTVLMDQNGDSVASLARKSGLPYTTVDGLFKKGFANARITTIERICDAYGVSMDYLIRDEIDDPHYGMVTVDNLSTEEQELVFLYRRAEPTARSYAREMLSSHPQEKVTFNEA